MPFLRALLIVTVLGCVCAAPPPASPSVPPPAKDSPEALAIRKAVQDFPVAFSLPPESPGRIGVTWRQYRTKGGKGWVRIKEGEPPPGEGERVERAKVKYEFQGPAEVRLSILGDRRFLYLGTAGSGSLSPHLPPWAISLEIKAETKASVDVELAGRPPRSREDEGFRTTLLRLVARAAAGHRMLFVADGAWVVAAQLVVRGDGVALSVRSVQPIAEAPGITAAVREAIESQRRVIAEYDSLASGLKAPIGGAFTASAWTTTLAASEERDQSYFSGCWHCSNRPSAPGSRDLFPLTCDGCEHVPGCGGREEDCAACRRGVPRDHVITREEKRRYDDMVELAISQVAGEAAYAEVRITIPCTHRMVTLKRRVLERKWSSDGTISVREGMPEADAILLLDSAGLGPIASSVEQGPAGSVTFRFRKTLEDTVPAGPSAASQGGPAGPTLPNGRPVAVLDVLDVCRAMVHLKDGRWLRLRNSPSRDFVILEVPEFADWSAARSSSSKTNDRALPPR